MDACPFHCTPLRNALEFCVRAAVESLVGGVLQQASSSTQLTALAESPNKAFNAWLSWVESRQPGPSGELIVTGLCRLSGCPLAVAGDSATTSYVCTVVTQREAASSSSSLQRQEVCALVRRGPSLTATGAHRHKVLELLKRVAERGSGGNEGAIVASAMQLVLAHTDVHPRW